MKNLMYILVLLVFVAAFSSPAFATTSITDEVSVGQSSFTPSTNVTVNAMATDTQYTATSAHSSGAYGFATTEAVSVVKSNNKLPVTNGKISPSEITAAGTLPSGYTVD